MLLHKPLRSSAIFTTAAGVAFGFTGALYALRYRNRRVRADTKAIIYPHPNDRRVIIKERPMHTRFNGKLNYRQLSIGSFTGLFAGYVIGKLSKVLVILIASGLLTIQFLQSRGIVPIGSTIVGQFAQWSKKNVDFNELILDQPSFKISFLSSFLVAAFYA